MSGDIERQGIAIIGMACRFPGANDLAAFWENLEAGVESIRHFSDAELLSAGVPERLLARPGYVKAASVIDGFDLFDAGFFEYSAREARLMDPQQRILLEEAWHALEDAGWPPGREAGRVGVFAGSGGVMTSYLLAHRSLHEATTGGLEHLANDKDFLATRLSYKLGLTGPSVNVQTACSTSLVAVHLACQSILDGECEMALAGGSTVRVPQVSGYLHRQGDIMSPDGRCRAYDAAAEGTVFGSGAGVVVLKHVEDAIADGDRIYAVILGSAVNNDGAAKVSYTASSTEGQARAMAAAFAAAGIAPSSIGYVEGHGTGTVVGDPLEVEALRRCFATDPETRAGGCLLGSVKTNIGHLEQAAGVASLIKAALAVHHGRIPASLNFNEPNPRIDFAGGPFRVPVAAADWTAKGVPRRAAVNSLGLGGTNAFAILEEAPAPVRPEVAPLPMRILALSARSKPAIGRLVDRWRDRLAGLGPEDAADACFTAARGRAQMEYRVAVTAPDAAGLARGLIDAGSEPVEARGGRKLAFLFPGQGTQYPGMARAFHERDPAFREAFDGVAARLCEKDGPDIAALVFSRDDAAALARTEAQQPALFAIEWALAEMLRQWGVRPDAVLGHSVGAFAAAAVAGIYDMEDAADLIAGRAMLMGALPEGGSMAALLTDDAEAAEICDGIDGVVLAALNSPSNTVVSGEAAAVANACERAGRAGVAVRPLSVSHAFHSPLMRPAAEPLAALAAKREAKGPHIAFVSDSTGDSMTDAPGPDYPAEHLLNPVRFADGLRTLATLGCTDFVEIGPGAALRGFAAATLADAAPGVHGLLDPKNGDWEATARTLARLWECGYPVDLARYHGGAARRLVSAPLYPFERSRYWLEEDRGRGEEDDAGLAGSEIRVPGPSRHFQARYSAHVRPWLPDHRVYGHVTLPVAAALVSLAEAGAGVAGARVEVRDLTYQEAFVLADEEERLVDVELPGVLDAGQGMLRSAEKEGSGAWREHVRASLRRSEAEAPEAADLAALRSRLARVVEPGAFYAVLDRLGLNYGRGFRNVRELYLGEGKALGRIGLADDAPEAAAAIHPAALDACLHLFPAVSGLHGNFSAEQEGDGVTFLPITVERFAVFGDMSGDLWSHCILRAGERPKDGRFTLDVRIYAGDGAPLAVIEGLTVKRLPEAEFLPRRKAPVEDWLYGIDWVARPALPEPETAPEGRWLVIAENPVDVRALTQALEAAGAACRVVPSDALTSAEGSGEMEALVGKGPVAGILLATALAARPLMSCDPADLTTATERQFRVIKAVLGLASETLHGAGDQPRIRILTRGAQAPLDDRLGGEALQAMIWGYGRVIALEHPSLYGGMIDLDDRTDPRVVVREILSSDGEDQVALRDDRRYVPRLVRRVLEGPERPVQPPVRPDCSYLVTGGLGTLGLRVADWLVARGARHVCLASRRAPAEDQQARIAALEARGASVRVVSADVSDPAQVSELIERIGREGPALNGVFHCAGLLDDGIMIEMDWERFHRVTAAKVEGAWALHLATEALGLGHFVLFSSILSVIGSMGQLNYVAGNAFLDALGAYRRRLGLSATVMNWGPWEEAGLATESGERGRAIWRARGTNYIPVEEGMAAMTKALAHRFDHLVVTLTNWPRFVDQFAETPKLYESLAGADGGGNRRSRMNRAAMLDQLNAAPAQERPDLLVEALGEICAGVLEADAPPEPDVSLREAGLDSLMSITLINEIEGVFGVRLAARALLRGPSVAELAEMLMEAQPALRGKEGGEATGASPGTANARPKTQSAAAGDGTAGAWLVVNRPRSEARVRLICFPFAGGGSAVFDHWGDAFDSNIEIIAVEPPGRLSRINEKPVTTVEAFARGLLPELCERLDRPYAVLGHCLGGLTLYETLRFLDARDHPLPTHIFVSGARPPSALRAPGDFERELDARLRRFVGYRTGKPGFEQPDDVFAEIIRAFGIADSASMLEEGELRDLVLPTVRAEFAMANRYIYLPESPFPVPITCFRGAHDEYFREIDAQVWRRFTSKRFELFTRDTGHFAIVEDFDFIRETIEARLLGHAAARP